MTRNHRRGTRSPKTETKLPQLLQTRRKRRPRQSQLGWRSRGRRPYGCRRRASLAAALHGSSQYTGG